jgi:hypothetical protein
MTRSVLYLLWSIFSFAVNAQSIDSQVVHSLYLIGDAGEPFIVNSTIGEVLRQEIKNTGAASTVVLLGDNIYPKGMPDPDHKRRGISEKILGTQVSWIRGTAANEIFVPGNHDWLRGKRNGWQQITNQQQWIDSLNDKHVTLLPKDGCPGPVEVPLDKNTTLVILDTQWFLHPGNKPGEESSCDAKTPAEALLLLNDIFVRNPTKRIILAAHHPLITYGEHGGVFTLKDHLFPFTSANPKLYLPLPIVGSLYPLYRKWMGNIQDTSHPLYKEMAQGISGLMARYPGTIYAAGHEHALQAIVKGSSYFVVSGAGVKTTVVKKKKYARFAASNTGFVKADIFSNGSVRLTYFQVDAEFPKGKVVFTDSLPTLKRKALAPNGGEQLDFKNKVVKVKGSSQYAAGKGKKRFLGENYREAWKQEIEVPVLDLGTQNGGLKVLQKGGGMQTLSLRLEDSTGREFVLRSVEKFPEKAVPEIFRKTVIQSLVQDGISASHPYAALVVPSLAEAAGIYHTNPKVVYIPDDPRLGIYRQEFANTLALFEERPAGDWSDKSNFGNSKDIVNTSKVLERLAKDNDNHVDQLFVLRSRLVDLWIGDWDRHDDQWRWATFKSKKGDEFRPIPRDRDQAFFLNEGIIPKMYGRRWVMPKFEGFNDEVNWPSGLSYNARYFDRFFLTEPSEEDWINVAKDLQLRLTDDVIERSIREWPDDIYQLDGAEIIRKLKARRNKLVEDAVKHYKFLAREVTVLGSNKDEYFHVVRLPAGDVSVKMFKAGKDGDHGKKLYDRVFKKTETKAIDIYGFGGNDKIKVDGTAAKSILVRVIGGEGKDLVEDSSRVNGLGHCTIFYDLKDSTSHIVSKGEVANRTSKNPAVNSYDRRAFKYDRLAPLVFGNYNVDDGFFIGAGFFYQKEGFRKTPFKSRHFALASFAPRTNSYNFLYRGDFTDVIGKWGVAINADLKVPNYVNNFFGMGNESVYDQNIDEDPQYDLKRPIDYYRFRFEEIRFEGYLTRKIGGYGLIKIGPAFQRIGIEKPEEDQDRFISDYATTVPYDLFSEHNGYAGTSWNITIDKKNSLVAPSRGIVFSLSGRNMLGTDRKASDFSHFDGFVSLYQSFHARARVVFAARIGGGWNTGNYEFYQAQVLDGKTEIRGFRKTRFYGDRKFYTNLEMRVKLFSIRTYLFPASLGILGFHDLGRVWYKDENGVDPTAPSGKSNAWHKGWGGGVWFTPFNLAILSVEAAHTVEGTLGYIRLGYLF